MKIIERRGRPRKFKAQMAVFWIGVFTTIAVCISLMAQDVLAQYEINDATTKIEEYKNYQAKDLAEENKLLEQKLARSMKVETNNVQKELVRVAIRKYFPQNEWATAEKVSTCESGMNPLSLNDKNTNGSVDRGPWQINSVHAKRFEQFYGVKWELGAHDIDTSTKYAKFLYDHSGWNPWVCYRIINK